MEQDPNLNNLCWSIPINYVAIEIGNDLLKLFSSPDSFHLSFVFAWLSAAVTKKNKKDGATAQSRIRFKIVCFNTALWCMSPQNDTVISMYENEKWK